jgi:pimeloyl-ACP methyl ester carboxylesterase
MAARLAATSMLVAALMLGSAATDGSRAADVAHSTRATLHRTVKVDGLDIFYREAGPKDAPTILLLHGFPTSSQMFRNLIPVLADRFHLVAPDYPGFGNSAMPTVDEFDYSFEHLAEVVEGFTEALGLETYSLYVMDYGAPVGFRLAVKHPQRVEALIIQNGNAYDEGLRAFWAPFRAYWKERTESNAEALRGFLTLAATQWQWTHGTRDPEAISPDTSTTDRTRRSIRSGRPTSAPISPRHWWFGEGTITSSRPKGPIPSSAT